MTVIRTVGKVLARLIMLNAALFVIGALLIPAQGVKTGTWEVKQLAWSIHYVGAHALHIGVSAAKTSPQFITHTIHGK